MAGAVQVPIWDNFLIDKGRASAGPSSSMSTVVEDCPEADDKCEKVSPLERDFLEVCTLAQVFCRACENVGV